MPKLGSSLLHEAREPLNEIRGQVPSLRKEIVGCAFAPRCDRATEICREVAPLSTEVAPSHFAACHNPAGAKAFEPKPGG